MRHPGKNYLHGEESSHLSEISPVSRWDQTWVGSHVKDLLLHSEIPTPFCRDLNQVRRLICVGWFFSYKQVQYHINVTSYDEKDSSIENCIESITYIESPLESCCHSDIGRQIVIFNQIKFEKTIFLPHWKHSK